MFKRSALTEALCTALRQSNGLISYEALAQVAGRPLSAFRGTLANCRKYLEADEGIVFEAEWGKGLRRLTDSEKVESLTKFTRRIHRTAGAGVQRIGAVRDMAGLSNDDQLRATIRRTVLHAVQKETSQDG